MFIFACHKMKVLISLEFHYWEGTTPIDGATATPKLDQMLEEWKDVDSTALMSLWEVVLREIKEVTDEKIAQILDQARSMGYLHIDMAWEIGVLDPLVWLVYILHLNCLIHHYRRHFPAQRGSWTVGGVTWWHSAPDRLGLEDVFFLSGRLWLAWFKTLAWKRIWVIFGFELCPGSKGVEFDRLDSFGLIWDENFAMSLEAKNFCSTHKVFHLMPSPNQWSKSPFNVHHRCLLQLSPSWVRCWRKIPCNVLQHAWHWMTATWAQCWQVWAIPRSLSNATCS